jgi:hypothetical protein
MIYVKIACTIVIGGVLLLLIIAPFCLADRDDDEGKLK